MTLSEHELANSVEDLYEGAARTNNPITFDDIIESIKAIDQAVHDRHTTENYKLSLIGRECYSVLHKAGYEFDTRQWRKKKGGATP